MDSPENLHGIRGWLTFYVVITGIGIAANVPAIRDCFSGNLTPGGLIRLGITVLQASGVALIFFCRRSVTRTFHVSLYGVLLVLAVLGSAVSRRPEDLNAVLGAGIWLVYWGCSERVRVNFPRTGAIRRAGA